MAAFETLQRQLPALAPAQALTALERYSLDNENPAACESFEIARLMSDQEVRLVFLDDGAARIPAQASYRCYQLTRRTLECKGAVADDTSKPFSAGITPLTRPLGPRVAIVSETSGLTLVGVFHTSLSRLLNGNPPTRIQRRGNEIAVRSLPTDSILIAIFKRSEQWAYRKFVWYYR